MATGEAPDLRRVSLFRGSSLGFEGDRESTPFLAQVSTSSIMEDGSASNLSRSTSLPSAVARFGHTGRNAFSISLDRTRSGRILGVSSERVPAQTIAARMLRRSGSAAAARMMVRQQSRTRRILMRQESMLIREAAALQVEDMQSQLSNSQLLMLIVLCWNIACLLAVAVSFPFSSMETTTQPLRLWLVGYMVQCAHHVWRALVLLRGPRPLVYHAPPPMSPTGLERGGFSEREFPSGEREYPPPQSPSPPPSSPSSSALHGPPPHRLGSTFLQMRMLPWLQPLTRSFSNVSDTSFRWERCALQFEAIRPLLSFLWWLAGLVWLASSDMALSDSPLLYWLCLMLLALDAFYICFCMSIAFLIGIAVCFYLPGVISMLQQVTDVQEGASESAINSLPRFKFCMEGSAPDVEMGEVQWGKLVPVSQSGPGRILEQEDAECCICLDPYKDGCDVRELPCHHHYHTMCIDSWLQINSTCPLCKYDILPPRREASP